MGEEGAQLLHAVGVRILSRWLEQNRGDVSLTGGRASFGGRGVDLLYPQGMSQTSVKVKVDPYYGTEANLINDRDLPFYRASQSSFAFEAVANAATRERGWMFDSDATELFYYFLTLTQPEAEVAELMDEDDEAFFSELVVGSDELVIMPMAAVRAWFEEHHERYAPRPVAHGFTSAWFRVIPRGDIESAVPHIRSMGRVFSAIRR